MKVEISEDGFINMLMNHNGGATVQDLDRQLILGNQAVLDHGGVAEINLKYKIARIKEMDSGMVTMPKVTVKFPEEPPIKQAMFLTKGNGLSAQHQSQESLPLGEEIQKPKRELEEVAPKNVSHIGDKK